MLVGGGALLGGDEVVLAAADLQLHLLLRRH